MPKQYTSPEVHTLGTVRDLTAQIDPNDKIGSSADALTAAALALGITLDGKVLPDGK